MNQHLSYVQKQIPMRQEALFDTSLQIPASPSSILVQVSGGKDSTAALLETLEVYGPERVIVCHQQIEEDWPGTVEYVQDLCEYLRLPLYVQQGHYWGVRCLDCGHTSQSSNLEKVMCLKQHGGCGSRRFEVLAEIDSITDMALWRGKFPGYGPRWCTSHFKRDVLNRWLFNNRALIGATPLVVIGERWAESQARAKLSELEWRSVPHMPDVLQWHPILSFSRRDSFRKGREHGIEPHYCYKVQWRELLFLTADLLDDEMMDGFLDHLMYEVDEEGGPRCSCVNCYLKRPTDLVASYRTPEGRARMERTIEVEEQIGFTLVQGQPLRELLAGKV